MRDPRPTSPRPPKVLDRVREANRLRHGSRRTAKFHVGWIRQSVLISGVEFAGCDAHWVVAELSGIPVNTIALEDLKANKRASGRLKDLADVENLP